MKKLNEWFGAYLAALVALLLISASYLTFLPQLKRRSKA